MAKRKKSSRKRKSTIKLPLSVIITLIIIVAIIAGDIAAVFWTVSSRRKSTRTLLFTLKTGEGQGHWDKNNPNAIRALEHLGGTEWSSRFRLDGHERAPASWGRGTDSVK